MKKTELYTIGPVGNGTLSVMPKPDATQLIDDIAFYHRQGVNKVISLLLPEEVTRLQMEAEPQACEAHQIEFVNFAIKDMGVPEYPTLKAFNQELKQDLAQGKHLAIHCHGGRGRAGIVAITLMIEHGLQPEQAIKLASEVRGDPMPVNDLQTQFVLDYQ